MRGHVSLQPPHPNDQESTMTDTHGSGPVVLHESVHRAVAGLRRTLLAVVAVSVVLELLWGVLAPGRPWVSALVAVVATVALVSLTWLTVSRAAAGPETLLAWIAGGYVAKVVIVAAALLGARAAGLDVRMVGICVVIVVVVALGCEVWAFVRARVPAVVPVPRERGTSGDEGAA